MKRSFKILSKSGVVTLILIAALSITQTVFAATDTSLSALTTDIKNNMLNRICGAVYYDSSTGTPIYDSNFTVKYSGTNVKQVQSDISTALNTIYDQDNYLEWIIWGGTYSYSVGSTGSTITFNIAWLETAQQSATVTSTVDSVLSQIITAGMNDYQKEKAINDYIVKTVYYDYYDTPQMKQHSAYAGLVDPNHSTVCQGYALITYRFYSETGIPVRIVVGTADGGGHAWNLVQIGGNWYELDNTWDDPINTSVGATYNKPDYNYYNLTDAQLSKDHTFTVDPSRPAVTDFKTKLGSMISSSSDSLKTFYNNLYTTLGYGTYSGGGSSATVSVTSVSVSPVVISINVGATSALVATVAPNNATNKGVTFTSSNTSVATVTVSNGNAIIKGIGAGTATITVKTNDGSKTATCVVAVVQPVTGVSLNKSSLSLKVGSTDSTLVATVAPSNATNKGVTFTSSNTSVATVTVSNGSVVVKGIKAGTSTITVKTNDGSKTATVVVTVVNK